MEIIGVVTPGIRTAKLSASVCAVSVETSFPASKESLAVRIPVADVFDSYSKGAARLVAVSDEEITAAMRFLFRATHNVAEGAGAAALAAAIRKSPK